MLAKQAARESGAFEAWLVDERRAGHRGRLDQCLDRHARTASWSPGSSTSDPGRHHPRHADVDVRRRCSSSSTSGRSRSPRRSGARRPSSPAPRRSCSRWSSIDGAPVGDGKPGPTARAAARGYCRASLREGEHGHVNAAETARPPRAVLFDWDNTLVDSWPTIVAAERPFTALGMPPWTRERGRRRRAHGSLRDSLPGAVRRALGARRATSSTTRFQRIHLERLSADAGRRRAAGGAVGAGCYRRASSATRRRTLRARGGASGLGSLVFRAAWSARGTAARDKPAPRPSSWRWTAAGIAAGADVWFVGDTRARHGVRPGQRAACPLLVRRGRPSCRPRIRWRFRRPCVARNCHDAARHCDLRAHAAYICMRLGSGQRARTLHRLSRAAGSSAQKEGQRT